jgi:large subunit ribosomal protein L24
MVKRHTRQSPGQTGGIVDKEGTIHISNVAMADPKGGAATRVGFRFLDDGTKVRFARRSGEVIDR